MSRWSGLRSFIRFPAMMTSPALARSSPAIMRKVVVLPHPDGPKRQTTSPAETLKLTFLTAVNEPNCFVTPRSSIVDIALSLDGAERDATQKLVLQRKGHDDHRDQEQRFDSGQETPADADVTTDRLRHGDRN